MSYTLDLLKQLADGLARQFGPDCEIVITFHRAHQQRSCDKPPGGGRTFKSSPGNPSQGSGFFKRPSWIPDPYIQRQDTEVQHHLHP